MESFPEVKGRAEGVISQGIIKAPEENTSSKPERKYQRQIIQECLLVPTGGRCLSQSANKTQNTAVRDNNPLSWKRHAIPQS